MTNRELRLTLDEVEDKCDNLFSLGKFSQILALAADYEVSDYWIERVQFMEVVLHTLGLTEELLVRYIDHLFKIDLDFEYTEFITNDVQSKGQLRFQIVLHSKHQTEGGRVMQELTECQRALADAFNLEERRQLAAVTFTIYVDGYDDDEIEEDENDPENADDDALCDIEGTCYCPKCVAEREAEVGDEDVLYNDVDMPPDPEDPPPRNRYH